MTEFVEPPSSRTRQAESGESTKLLGGSGAWRQMKWSPHQVLVPGNLVPRGCVPFGQHQGSKTSGLINVKIQQIEI